MNEIATFDHISRYGRPLWFNSKKYLSGGVEEVVRTAQVKLLKDNHYANTEHQALALLSQRFALDIIFGHPKAVQHVDEAVASHLRICITSTEDRSWRFTAYPSEPLLSHAAAEEMWRNSTLTNTLAHLKIQLERGMIEPGKNGFLCKETGQFRTRNVTLLLPPIPVRWWLEELFGPNVWPKDEAQRKVAEEAFASATINFSHWISMSERIIPFSSDVRVVDAEEWLKRNFPLIDQVIPSYDPDSSSFSPICISTKFRNAPSLTDVNKITVQSSALNIDTGRPWIAITLDLGVPTAVSSTYPTKSVRGTSPCLRIYAAGMNSSTFPFLRHDGLDEAMKGIQDRAIQPPADGTSLSMMREQVRVGTSRRPIHMRWEGTRTFYSE
ncbi:hypothetical protein K439DRAFT_1621321 [Ramaria rubella]|nr:hypothetical protein K439DRAFT_1621321 [Ramaria rubella]